MALSMLITQCLQRDFVDPVRRHDTLPNLLHVGAAEAERLLGRTGTIAACSLVEAGLAAADAVAAVRRARGARAVETAGQEQFVIDHARLRASSEP